VNDIQMPFPSFYKNFNNQVFLALPLELRSKGVTVAGQLKALFRPSFLRVQITYRERAE
jgi:hypothetical protein